MKTQIADIIKAHRMKWMHLCCTCGQLVLDEADHARHVADVVFAAIKRAGYTILDTNVLSTVLNFGYGKQPTPEGAIARANLREQYLTK